MPAPALATEVAFTPHTEPEGTGVASPETTWHGVETPIDEMMPLSAIEAIGVGAENLISTSPFVTNMLSRQRATEQSPTTSRGSPEEKRIMDKLFLAVNAPGGMLRRTLIAKQTQR